MPSTISMLKPVGPARAWLKARGGRRPPHSHTRTGGTKRRREALAHVRLAIPQEALGGGVRFEGGQRGRERDAGCWDPLGSSRVISGHLGWTSGGISGHLGTPRAISHPLGFGQAHQNRCGRAARPRATSSCQSGGRRPRARAWQRNSLPRGGGGGHGRWGAPRARAPAETCAAARAPAQLRT